MDGIAAPSADFLAAFENISNIILMAHSFEAT